MRRFDFAQFVSTALAFIFAALFLVGIGYAGLQVGDRSLPVTLLAAPLLETPTVRAGDDVRVRFKFVVEKYCPTHVDTFLFDSTGALVKQESNDFETGQALPGQPANIVFPIPTPIDLAGGRTKFRALTTYRCNWVQGWWPLHPPPFEVTWTTVAVPPDEIEQRVSDELKQLLLETPK